MNFTLSNGLAMPVVGIGTFTMTPAQAETAVLCALTSGYRMIDTAQAYMNERAVGRAIRKSGVARGEIFLSTKIWASQYNTEGTVEKSLELLGHARVLEEADAADRRFYQGRKAEGLGFYCKF